MEKAQQHTTVEGRGKEVIDPGWNKGRRLTFSPAIKSGNLLFISGLIGKTDERGNIISKGNIAAQAREIYEKIGVILKMAGGTFDDVVKTTDYVTTFEGYKDTSDVRRKVFKEPFPAATGVLVSGLVRKDALIEIDAIAVLDEGAK
jgi:enamine deaminase RidA (YjgF/YER057c/UK114 family)